jgi:hypothetical protein
VMGVHWLLGGSIASSGRVSDLGIFMGSYRYTGGVVRVLLQKGTGSIALNL